MLYLTIEPLELWDEANNRFIHTKERKLTLEHSLLSLSKWESKWCKAFLGKEEKTLEETIDYIRCMTITQNVDPDVYSYLSADNVRSINEYIEAPMTATKFFEPRTKRINGETITSELIYYWMIELGIPFECQRWHLNRLLTLIHVINLKRQPAKKMSRQELAARNAALNAERCKRLGTRG